MATSYVSLIPELGVRFYRWNDHRRRRKGNADWANSRDYRYIAASHEISPNWQTSLLSAPYRNRDEHLILGADDGREFVSFEQVGEDMLPGVREGRRVIRKHVVAVRLPRRLPWFQMETESVAKKLQQMQLVGSRRLDFESAEFNKAWRVSSMTDEQFASLLVHPQFMEWALREQTREWAFLITGTDLVAIRGGRQSPEKIEAGLAMLKEFVMMVPEQVFHDYGSEYPQTPFALGV